MGIVRFLQDQDGIIKPRHRDQVLLGRSAPVMILIDIDQLKLYR